MTAERLRVLILGGSGLLGSCLFDELSRRPELTVRAAFRGGDDTRALFPPRLAALLLGPLNLERETELEAALETAKPQVLINAAGLIHHRAEEFQTLAAIEINARLPHVLLKICRARGIRLIHYSTDCVFSGRRDGPLTEEDAPDASDIYGLTKLLGEIDEPDALTIRTSFIGPELRHKKSLLEWFLACEREVDGYAQVIYAGLPADEQARLLAGHILPNHDLAGLYQAAGPPISKYELLKLIAAEYGLTVNIRRDEKLRPSRRLSGEKLKKACGYEAAAWPELIARMRAAHERRRAEWSGGAGEPGQRG